jgi:hypothetical protein
MIRTGRGGASSLVVAVVATVASAACRAESPTPRPGESFVTVGRHRVAFRVPAGWKGVGGGREHHVERGILRITLADRGPVEGAAFAREIERARAVWRRGRREDARAVLMALRLKWAFPSEEAWESFRGPWNEAYWLHEDVPPADLEYAFGRVLYQILRLPPPDLETCVDWALPGMGHDTRQEIAGRRRAVIDGRDALWIDTWDRLSHGHRRRYLFVVSDGHLLVVRSARGYLGPLEEALDAVVGSLRFEVPTPIS